MRDRGRDGSRRIRIVRRQLARVKLELPTSQRGDVRVGGLTTLPARQQDRCEELCRAAFRCRRRDQVAFEPPVRRAIVVGRRGNIGQRLERIDDRAPAGREQLPFEPVIPYRARGVDECFTLPQAETQAHRRAIGDVAANGVELCAQCIKST